MTLAAPAPSRPLLARLGFGRLRRVPVVVLLSFAILALALIVLFGIWLASDLFFEAALLIAVMGFVGTVAVGKHLLHGDIID